MVTDYSHCAKVTVNRSVELVKKIERLL